MKNLSKIKSTLAVSMLISASLFSMDASSVLEDALGCVHGKKAPAKFASIDLETAQKKLHSYVALNEDSLLKQQARVGAAKKALSDAIQNQEDLISVLHGKSDEFHKAKKSRKKPAVKFGREPLEPVKSLAKQIGAFHKTAVAESNDPEVVEAQKRYNELRFESDVYGEEYNLYKEAIAIKQEKASKLNNVSKKQFDNLIAEIEQYPGYDKEILKHIRVEKKEKEKKVAKFTVTTQKEKIHGLNDLAEAINQANAGDKYGLRQDSLSELKDRVSKLQKTRKEIRDNKEETKSLQGKAESDLKKHRAKKEELAKFEEEFTYIVIDTASKSRSLKGYNQTLQNIKDLLEKKRVGYTDAEREGLQLGVAKSINGHVIRDSRSGHSKHLITIAHQMVHDAQGKVEYEQNVLEAMYNRSPDRVLGKLKTDLEVAEMTAEYESKPLMVKAKLEKRITTLSQELAKIASDEPVLAQVLEAAPRMGGAVAKIKSVATTVSSYFSGFFRKG